MDCPECKSENTVKAGLSWRKRKRIQRYRCNNCGLVFVESEK